MHLSLIPCVASCAGAAAARVAPATGPRPVPALARPLPASARPCSAPARRPAGVAAAVPVGFEAAPSLPASGPIPAVAGVYAVYDPQGTLQFVGISRKVAVSVATHAEAIPELVGSVKVLELPTASKDELTGAWKEWIQEAGERKSRFLGTPCPRRCRSHSFPTGFQ